jgi:hypothetical protein
MVKKGEIEVVSMLSSHAIKLLNRGSFSFFFKKKSRNQITEVSSNVRLYIYDKIRMVEQLKIKK